MRWALLACLALLLAACKTTGTAPVAPAANSPSVEIAGVSPSQIIQLFKAYIESPAASQNDKAAHTVSGFSDRQLTFLTENKSFGRLRGSVLKSTLIATPTNSGTRLNMAFSMLQNYDSPLENETSLDNAAGWVGADDFYASWQQNLDLLKAQIEAMNGAGAGQY